MRGTCGDGDFCGGVVAIAIQRFHLVGNGFTQHGHTGHGWVLVEAVRHGIVHTRNQLGVAIEIRKTLAEVDRIFFGRQRRHHRENGGADFGKFGVEVRGGHKNISV